MVQHSNKDFVKQQLVNYLLTNKDKSIIKEEEKEESIMSDKENIGFED